MIERDVPAASVPQQWSGIFDARRLTEALKAAGPPLLFGLRLWASVCLALYIAFWLELDNAYWAGTSAAIGVVSAHRRNAPTVPGSSHRHPAPVQAGPTPAASPAARAERRFGARPEPSRCGGRARSKFGQRANRKTRCRSPHPRW